MRTGSEIITDIRNAINETHTNEFISLLVELVDAHNTLQDKYIETLNQLAACLKSKNHD